jgi:ATP-dependent Lon protease
MVRFPWNTVTEDTIDVADARAVLDDDHHGLDEVKDRILEYLAVRTLKDDMRGPILCLVGAPGVGKTSLGKSVARALGREFVRMSLGGVRDEAELRGHRRTYIGAMPGRIVQALTRAGTRNPVFMLDEVDKLGADYRGDPASALLEILDPEQNEDFRDHYLDVPIDLSQVLFIANANVLHTIPGPLLNRMEVLEVPGYTIEDKVRIAERYLVPKQLAEHGLADDQADVATETLELVAESYTREAGVRSLDRAVATLARKAARRVVEDDVDRVEVTPELARDWLGPERFRLRSAEERDEVGVATGLAVTAGGGDVLKIEVALVPGQGRVKATGQLGDVMKESTDAAVTYVRSQAGALGLDESWLDEVDVHIHVPEGAVPKDGPSAGITMTTALASALTGRAIHRTVGMTGEVTLRGKVLPIGGAKEKVLAAHRAGLTTVLLPDDNERDLRDLPAEIRDELDLVFVGDMAEVLSVALLAESESVAAA